MMDGRGFFTMHRGRLLYEQGMLAYVAESPASGFKVLRQAESACLRGGHGRLCERVRHLLSAVRQRHGFWSRRSKPMLICETQLKPWPGMWIAIKSMFFGLWYRFRTWRIQRARRQQMQARVKARAIR